jgi:hypothetical protein
MCPTKMTSTFLTCGSSIKPTKSFQLLEVASQNLEIKAYPKSMNKILHIFHFQNFGDSVNYTLYFYMHGEKLFKRKWWIRAESQPNSKHICQNRMRSPENWWVNRETPRCCTPRRFDSFEHDSRTSYKRGGSNGIPTVIKDRKITKTSLSKPTGSTPPSPP